MSDGGRRTKLSGKRWRPIHFIGTIVAVFTLACAGGTALPTSTSNAPTATPLPPAVTVVAPTAAVVSSPSPNTTGTGAALPSEADPLVQRAKQNLAGQLGVAADQIQIVSVTRTAWSDSSLGCPRPGQMYAQIVTPGYRIILQGQGKTYEYHTDLTQRVVACPQP